jgi:hypothetical protein
MQTFFRNRENNFAEKARLFSFSNYLKNWHKLKLPDNPPSARSFLIFAAGAVVAECPSFFRCVYCREIFSLNHPIWFYTMQWITTPTPYGGSHDQKEAGVEYGNGHFCSDAI